MKSSQNNSELNKTTQSKDHIKGLAFPFEPGSGRGRKTGGERERERKCERERERERERLEMCGKEAKRSFKNYESRSKFGVFLTYETGGN